MKLRFRKEFFLRKVLILLSMLILSSISYSYQHKLSEPLDNFNYLLCTSVRPSYQSEKGVLRVNLNECAVDRGDLSNNNFFWSANMGIRTENVSELQKYLNDNNAIVMLKCGIKGYTNFFKDSYIEVQRKDIVITDYDGFLKRYKTKYEDYRCIPK
jgi:hypothetical protein